MDSHGPATGNLQEELFSRSSQISCPYAWHVCVLAPCWVRHTHTHSPDQPKFFVFALQNEYIHDNLELLAMAPYIICKHGVARHHTTCRAGKEPAKP